MDLFRRRKGGSPHQDWSRSGNFMHKPDNGWIHPDEQLSTDGGICYGIRYVGCLRVKESMKNLDFDTRTALAREAIRVVSEQAGYVIADKRKKTDKRIAKLLYDTPNMEHAGANVNLTITVEGLNLVMMESGETIADHQMPGISFASGGDSDTLDFVAYVAKDAKNGRACYVFECGGGLAEDVITTIGQAFELRFKDFLHNQPKPMKVRQWTENQTFNMEASAWGDDNDDKLPIPDMPAPPVPIPDMAAPSVPIPEMAAPTVPISDVQSPPVPKYVVVSQKNTPAIAPRRPLPDTSPPLIDFSQPPERATSVGGSKTNVPSKSTNRTNSRDVFNMEALDDAVKSQQDSESRVDTQPATTNYHPCNLRSLNSEPWFHGKVSRKEAESLLTYDGDFLVRESVTNAGQYVLTGRHQNCPRNLLLIDPNGFVRTKDQKFDSVSHLINYHRDNDLPIVSQDSELRLIRPIFRVVSSH